MCWEVNPSNIISSIITADGIKRGLFCFCYTTVEMFMNKPSLSSKRKGNNRGMVYSWKWQHWNASITGFGSHIDYKSLSCATYIISLPKILWWGFARIFKVSDSLNMVNNMVNQPNPLHHWYLESSLWKISPSSGRQVQHRLLVFHGADQHGLLGQLHFMWLHQSHGYTEHGLPGPSHGVTENCMEYICWLSGQARGSRGLL